MKLFDPFAGIKLATGHFLFHISFFIGSFIVNLYSDPKIWYAGDLDKFEEDVASSETTQGK